MALVNIALVDATIGRDSKTISQNLNKARGVFNSSRHLIGTTLCDMVQADMELKEQQFHLVKFKLQESCPEGNPMSLNLCAWKDLPMSRCGQCLDHKMYGQ
jgi:hypothetical protein